MKIAMFGTTLYAGVISSLLAESGHQVFICNDLQDHTALFNLRDQDVVVL
jgi:UDPglucose 6-dehydrogenase